MKITEENKSDIYFKYNDSKYLPINRDLLRLKSSEMIISDFINCRITINTFEKLNATLELN